MKQQLLKQFFFTLLFTLCVACTLSAQTLFSTDFTTVDYTTGTAQTDLVNHADWNAGHFNNANTWVAFTTANPKDVIRTQSHFAYAIVDSTPITAVDGDVVTITVSLDLGFNGQVYGTTDRNLCFIGLLNKNNPTAGSEANGSNRDGVMVFNNGTTSEIELTGGTISGGVLSQELNSRTYEVVVEYTVGATNAASSMIARITNVGGTGNTATTTSSPGMDATVYAALTGAGAYFMDWALAFGQGDSTINTMQMNSIEITKNSAVLSTENFNSLDFAMFPNPVKNTLNIESKDAISNVAVYNLLGKEVMTSNTVTNALDVSALSKGVYLIKLTSNKGVASKKFVKE